MKFTEEVENLQKQNPGIIVLVKNGIFFVALGKDALILNENIGLKRTCMRERSCKVGFLVKSSEKYIKILEQKNLSFVLYVIDSKTEMHEEIYRYTGKICEETKNSLNCIECGSRKETENDIIERLRKIGK